MADRTIPCNRCSRKFADEGALIQHSRVKHGRPRKRRVKRRKVEEQSFADLAVEAEIDRAMGVYNFDQEWLLP